MSVDRYLAICRPMTSLPAASQARRWRMIVLAWLMAFVFATPQLFIFKQVPVDAKRKRRRIKKITFKNDVHRVQGSGEAVPVTDDGME